MSVRGRSQANRQRFGSSFLSSGRYMCAWVDDAATFGFGGSVCDETVHRDNGCGARTFGHTGWWPSIGAPRGSVHIDERSKTIAEARIWGDHRIGGMR